MSSAPRIAQRVAQIGKSAIHEMTRLSKEARVSTTPGIAFGPTGQSHLRLSFCVPHEMIDKAFDRINEFFG